MRLCLALHGKSNKLMLPIYYNRLVQGAIYNSISAELASFLHQRGYVRNGNSFKYFTFSRLMGTYYLDRINKKISFKNEVKLYISSPINEFCTSITEYLLGAGQIQLGPAEVEVTDITVENTEVAGESVIVDTISPLVVHSTFEKPEGGKYTYYFHPGEKEFTRQLEENLRRKYRVLYDRRAPERKLAVELLNLPRLNITMYKDTVIKGYTCRLKLNGPGELLQVAVDAGLGAKNSLGFGCVAILKNNKRLPGKEPIKE